jgi:hypothetical protein
MWLGRRDKACFQNCGGGKHLLKTATRKFEHFEGKQDDGSEEVSCQLIVDGLQWWLLVSALFSLGVVLP